MSGADQRVGKLAAGDLAALAAYRALSGWMLREADDSTYWLRVPASDEKSFRKLPLLGRWSAGKNSQITRDGRRVPEALLPSDGWQPVASLLPLGSPERGMPGMAPAPVDFTLETDTADLPAEALLCTLQDFAAWAETALAQRLAVLQLACCEDSRVFLTGAPLPGIRGRGFHRIGKLWLPCGYRLPDHLWPGLLEDFFRIGGSRFALLHADGSFESLDSENLIPASRAVVRATGESMTPV